MASAAEITQQIMRLNATVGELQARAAEAMYVIEAQHARIGTLEGEIRTQGGGQTGGHGGGQDYKRRVDLKVLAPEPFTSKDEHGGNGQKNLRTTSRASIRSWQLTCAARRMKRPR